MIARDGTTGESAVHVVLATIPMYGHVRPMLSLSRGLIDAGCCVSFIGGHAFRESIEATGAKYVPLHGSADYDLEQMEKYFPEIARLPREADTSLACIESFFIKPIPSQHQALQGVLDQEETSVRQKKLVVLSDLFFYGTLPMLLNSPHIKRVPCICVSTAPALILSKDVAPFGTALSPQGEKETLKLNALATERMADLQASLERTLEPYACPTPLPSKHPLDAISRAQDILYQLTPASMDWPRTDLPDNTSFIGHLPISNHRHEAPIPDWFQDFVVNDTSQRPLIVVTSGTMSSADSRELILPTIEACRDLHVRLVVCMVAAHLPESYELPANTRCASWIPFEKLLRYTSVFISNGGYNGICQSLAAGVPMIVAGVTEDKPETCARAAMTGAAINMGTQTPSSAQLGEALQKILSDNGEYKNNALRMGENFAATDAFGTILERIKRLTENSDYGWHQPTQRHIDVLTAS